VSGPNEPLISTSIWRLMIALLIATTLLAIGLGLLIAAGSAPAVDHLWWTGFDDRWTIENGTLDGDQLQLRPISNSIGLALHPIESAAFTFQTRMILSDTQLAAGLVVRAIDSSNLTAFLISSDGYASLRAMRQGQWIDLEPWQTWPHVRRGPVANQLKVECGASQCSFFVNNERTFETTSLTAGTNVGLIAYPLEQASAGSAAAFDQIRAGQLAP
jgi:hypothetical protein